VCDPAAKPRIQGVGHVQAVVQGAQYEHPDGRAAGQKSRPLFYARAPLDQGEPERTGRERMEDIKVQPA
jgi:hypothetical protein